MDNKKLYIHIGAPKTATTFLQRVVMPNFREAKCLVKPEVFMGGEKIRLKHLFRFPKDVWNGSESALESLFGSENERQNDFIISDEGVYGWAAAQQPRIGKLGPRTPLQSAGYPYFSFLASHLRRIDSAVNKWGFSGVRVLVTIRRQDTWLASMFSQFSGGVRGASQKSFDEWVQYLVHDPVGYYSGGGSKVEYYMVYKKLKNAIGSDNVLIIPFEMLKNDPKLFLSKWSKFIGEKNVHISVKETSEMNKNSLNNNTWRIKKPINEGFKVYPNRLQSILRVPNRIPNRWPDFGRDKEVYLSESLSDEIMQVYRESNEKLDKVMEHSDLKKYEYF
jgi:hypothetical protein